MTKKEFSEAKSRTKIEGYSELTVIDSFDNSIVMNLPLHMAKYDGKELTLSFLTRELLNTISFFARRCNFVISHNSKSLYSKKVELETVMNYVKSIIQKGEK